MPWIGSTGWPALMDSMTFFCPGMIQKNTLALMLVAIIAPTSRKAARPANQWQASQEAMQIKRNTNAPTMASPFFFWPKMRQMASYNTQKTTRKLKETPIASVGDQSIFDLSMR